MRNFNCLIKRFFLKFWHSNVFFPFFTLRNILFEILNKRDIGYEKFRFINHEAFTYLP